MNKNNIEIIYNEVCDTRKQQQGDVDLIYNKFNWIIVSDVILIVALLNLRSHNLLIVLALIFIIISLFLSLLPLNIKPFKRGPKLENLVENKMHSEEKFLDALNARIIQDIQENKNIVNSYSEYMANSIWTLVFGVIIIFFYFLIPVFFNLIKVLNLCRLLI